MLRRSLLAVLAAALLAPAAAVAQISIPPGLTPPAPPRTTPVGFPQDAGPHDESTIEWWYYNAFLTTESGRKVAVVASFFRTGIGAQKGHYFIYALTDLDAKTKQTGSVLDAANLRLLQGYLPLVAAQRPNDPRPMQMLALLQKGTLPKPHRGLKETAALTPSPFSIAMGGGTLKQASPDARTWKATIQGDDFSIDLTLTQPATGSRPPMLVGGEGKTGLTRPDDMFYVSLTRMNATATLTQKGKTEKATGDGWLDRQWGTSWVVGDNGWDWWGLQLSDGSDLIVYRVKDNKTGKILRAEATLLKPDGTQIVDTAPTFAADPARWKDPVSGIAYPQKWSVRVPKAGLTLEITPAFASQTIPVLGIGDAIWEGVVTVSGANGISGRGYMELVGYRAPQSAPKKP